MKLQPTPIDPLELITMIRDSHPDIYNIYTNGSCFQFSWLLVTLFFGEATPLYSEVAGHWITRIGKRHYDIGGLIKADYVRDNDFDERPEAWPSAYLASAGRTAPYDKYADVTYHER